MIPGETLTVIVGNGPGIQNGQAGSSFTSVYGGGGAGWGGGSGTNGGSPGGGRSAIRRGANELVTAGAGGGGGSSGLRTGGPGGGLQGIRPDGQASFLSSFTGGFPGGGIPGGGSQLEGGLGSRNPNFAAYVGGSGSQFQGGGRVSDYVTASGGSGWYGGGAGAGQTGAGAGGSSYIANLINGYTEPGVLSNAGGRYDPFWLSPIGQGCGVPSTVRGHGRVVFFWPTP